jgi:NAD(P)-dependent dehydrogenase (short-subunit alcohol dehydrogenase family)
VGSIASLVHAFDLTEKVAIVTGGDRGIGARLAARFAEAGAEVVITYLKNRNEADQVSATIRDMGQKSLVAPVDVRCSRDVDQLMRLTVATFGRLDVLVNNAGVFSVALLTEMEEDAWDEVLDVNLKGVFLCSRAAAKQMILRGSGGRIINISSIHAVRPSSSMAHYDASKAAVSMLTRALALELAPYGITVNAIGPGLIDSPRLASQAPELRRRFIERVPLGRIGNADDIASAALFFASDAAAWITGQTLFVDGGVLLAPAY